MVICRRRGNPGAWKWRESKFAPHAATSRAQSRIVSTPLCTHERMSKNLTFYRNLGFVEIEQRTEDGYARVYLHKRLA